MPAPLDPLELLRAQSGLAIDDEGCFLHRGEVISHARTLAVLWGSLARQPGGGWRVRIGREVADVAVAETPWVVRALWPIGDPPQSMVVRLADGSEEPLRADTLHPGPDGVLRCQVHGGETARFSRSAQISLGLLLEEDPPGSGDLRLRLAGTSHLVTGPLAR